MTRATIGLLVLLLAGCAASAQTRPAYVDAESLLANHPLYGTLAQYDRQIAALDGTLHTQFANTDAQIDNASRAVQNDARGVAAAYRNGVDASGKTVMANEPSFVQTSATSADTAIEQHIEQTYRQQNSQMLGAAQRDMATYRDAVAAQEQQAYNSFADAMNERVQQAIALRTQELREHEGNAMLELARKHAPQRLSLRAKLQTLVLRPEARKSVLAQLQTLQAQEDAALSAMRRQDASTLNAYSAHVRSQAESDLAQMRSKLETRAAGNLAARDAVLRSQRSGAKTLTIPSAPASGAGPADMESAYTQLRNASLPSDSAFAGAGNDITSHWKDLRNVNDDAVGHTRSQIAWLKHDREAVRKRMISQIMYEAQRLAKTRGYDNVIDGKAPAGSLDLTSAVRSDMATLSP